MIQEYTYRGLLIRWGSRPLAIVDTDGTERVSPDWSHEELEHIAAFMQLDESEQSEHQVAGPESKPESKTRKGVRCSPTTCKHAVCGKPRHRSGGILYTVCHEHYLERIRKQRNGHRQRQEAHAEAIIQVRAGRSLPMPYSDATGRGTGTKCARFHGVTDEFRTGCHLCGWRGAE